MVDRFYGDLSLAEMYDSLVPWGPTDAFCLEWVRGAGAVLDVGCGTGRLLGRARDTGHRGRLTGLDPAAAMLVQARRRAPGVQWVLGDLACVRWAAAFELVVMSGRVVQLLLDDHRLRASFAAVHRALLPGGRLVLDALNPAARPWETWTPDRVREITGPDGTTVRTWREADTPVRGARVTYADVFAGGRWERARESRGELRFLDAGGLDRFLAEAGFAVEERYGGGAREPYGPTSPEMVTVARRR
ncbi:class I SAM-dependent methyltransferase [Streptomyces sp. NPDC056716]|uniref:class I SAM-dependent methyltransferase n=1 Tax=unclassified Streptomyces TaxID=2593676 RepID=UPI0036CB3B9B